MAAARDILSRWRCRRLAARLVDFADGTLDSPAQAHVERHVARCQRCAGVVAALRAAPDIIARADIDPGEAFWRHQRRGIMRTIRTQPAATRRARRVPAFAWQTGLVAVATSVIAVIGYRTFRQPEQSRHVAVESLDTLDTESVVALSDLWSAIAPPGELLSAGRETDDDVIGAVANAAWMAPEGFDSEPQLADLSNDELDAVHELLGGIRG
jgi:hypothetical protein